MSPGLQRPILPGANVFRRKGNDGSWRERSRPFSSPSSCSIACARRRRSCERSLPRRSRLRWRWSAERDRPILSRSNPPMRDRSSGSFATMAMPSLPTSRWRSSAPPSNKRRTRPMSHAQRLRARKRRAPGWHSIARERWPPIDSSPRPRSTKRAPPCCRPKRPLQLPSRKRERPQQEPASSRSAHRWRASCWCVRSITVRSCPRRPRSSSWARCRASKSMRMSTKPTRMPCSPACPHALRCQDRSRSSPRR